MSRERAHRREQREREIAAAAEARAADAERRARREARKASLTGWIPRPTPLQSGTLAAKRRQQTVLLVAGVVAINVLVFLGTDTWAPRTLVLLLSVLLTPIAATVLTRK